MFNKKDELDPFLDCHLDIVYVLPPSVFVDPYQLRDLVSTIGTATVIGEHDLELPLEKIKDERGSIVFLRQHHVKPAIHLELPLHLRYQQPSNNKESQSITIQAPYAGWTCGGDSNESSYPTPLREKYSLLADLPLTAATTTARFTALTNSVSSTPPLELYVPVGRGKDRSLVFIGTFLIVVLCTLWIIRSVVASLRKRKRLDAKGKRRRSE
ncbi:PIG-X [Mycotypha africana]|uniref:PIG-X n=1 Tax=Mycotypha africana TaxID=64632 RepID=UPI002301C156|nr:PIG-X [Mycotypha africana]KAI8987781.1 PIG-X [Mycotypha africana]